MIKSVFIGTRIEALKALTYFSDIKLVITEKNSFVDKNSHTNDFEYIILENFNKKEIFNILDRSVFDLLLSAGFKYILPKKLLSKNSVFLNSHPSLLPHFKGKKAISDAFYNKEKFIGATLHYMDEKVDEGEIIFQDKFNISGLSLENVYQIIFTFLEPYVIVKGLEKLEYEKTRQI